ncbi:hypothetical protein [Streptomyces sp. Y7]|uniref:hypothetical protein n=1 Tax=Streptomyces sp. Y7 TaxID=3342392 RepID=UPI003716D6CC
MPMGVTAVEAVAGGADDVRRGGSGGEELPGRARFQVVPADVRPQTGRPRAGRRHLRVHLIGGGGVPLRGLDTRADAAHLVGPPAPAGPDLGAGTLTDLLGSIFALTHRQLSAQRPA